MHQIIINEENEFKKAVSHLEHDLQGVRGNRAHPNMIDDVRVEAYGSQMTLKELGSITVPEQRQLVFQAWDKSILKDVERAIIAQNLNVGVMNDGDVIRLTLPALTTESRQQLLKILGQKIEAAKISVRKVREQIREKINDSAKHKEMSEDDKFAALEDVEVMVKKYLQSIESLGDDKATEINTI